MSTETIETTVSEFDQIAAGIDTHLATIQVENATKTRLDDAKQRVGKFVSANLADIEATLARCSYTVERGKKRQRVVDAVEFYTAVWQDEFVDIIKTDSSTPDEWQFTRVVCGLIRAGLKVKFRCKDSDHLNAAWRSYCQVKRIGTQTDSVPNANETVLAIAEALFRS